VQIRKNGDNYLQKEDLRSEFAGSMAPVRGYAMKRRVVLRIWGRVQGVNYRRAAQREAVRLGVTGFARNMPDDSVWIEVEGPEDAIEKYIAWCEKGPPRSEVTQFEVQDGDLVGYKGFEIY
jgi:acylphosphatase